MKMLFPSFNRKEKGVDKEATTCIDYLITNVKQNFFLFFTGWDFKNKIV